MSDASKQIEWCPRCKEYVEAIGLKPDNRMMNVVLSILTMGIWLIVWLCTADLTTRTNQCPACGTKTQETAGMDAIEEDEPSRNSRA